MKSARNQLILLGFICQGFTWDDYVLPLGSVALWVICLTVAQGKVRFTPMMECFLLLLGSVGSLLAGHALGHNTHFFIGHGLTLMQAARLLRPLNRREQVFSVLMACFQLGVACTSLFDLRFVPVFLAMAVLLPRAFVEMESLRVGALGGGGGIGISWRLWSVLFGVAILFFLVFPRGQFGAPGQFLRTGAASGDSLLDNVLDPTRSGSLQSRRVLLQIQGAQLGYLRCYSLSEFDGFRWTTVTNESWQTVRTGGSKSGPRLLERKVRVKEVGRLGGVLPTDGRVYGVWGNFFHEVHCTMQGVAQCDSVWTTGNNLCSYWINPKQRFDSPSPSLLRRMTNCPQASERLANWIAEVTGGTTNSLEIAQAMEQRLKTNYTYRLGGPKLGRVNPLEEFLFVQKEGHCERFASSLALLLRMKGIPSRVVIGYLPHTQSGIEGWTNIRFNDAHAWTEAYIAGTGWITLDATPAASLPDAGGMFSDLWDAIDLAWNLHVVNFDRASQGELLSISIQTFDGIARWIAGHSISIGGAAVGLLVLGALGRMRFRRKEPESHGVSKQAQVVAGYYGKMLQALSRKGFHKSAHQTPNEYLESLPAQLSGDARLITEAFCESRYGGKVLSSERQVRLEEAVGRVEREMLQSRI